MDEKFYSVRDLKRELGSAAPSRSRCYELAEQGKLRLTRIGGRVGILSSEWQRFIRSGEPLRMGGGK